MKGKNTSQYYIVTPARQCQGYTIQQPSIDKQETVNE